LLSRTKQKKPTIVIFRALKLGDMLCSLPALQAVRNRYTDAKITLVTHPSMNTLFERFTDLVDEVLPFPGFPGMPESDFDPQQVSYFISLIQSRDFDIALQMHGSGEISNLVVSLFAARETYGLYLPGQHCPDLANFAQYPEHLSEVERCLSVVSCMGKIPLTAAVEFPVTIDDQFELVRIVPDIPMGHYFCLHPGASTEEKRWSEEGFAFVGDFLVSRGFKVVFTGCAKESSLVSRIRSQMTYQSIDTASLDLPLGALATLLKSSRGLICNDTGVSHLAALLRVPSLVLFSKTDPARWAPTNKFLHHSLQQPTVEEVLDRINAFLLDPLLKSEHVEAM
jgi:ADP-heptose:LPS heptosyltransferase